MKRILLISSVTIALALPVTAQNRDSDGDVLSTLPYTYDRDSDGNVVSAIYRDSDGNVISVIYATDDIFLYDEVGTVEVTPEVFAEITPDDSIAPPQQVAVNGLAYAVTTLHDRIFLTRLQDGVNPTAFTLD